MLINVYIPKRFPALSGVPQGSNRGHLLFLIIKGDMQDCVRPQTSITQSKLDAVAEWSDS